MSAGSKEPAETKVPLLFDPLDVLGCERDESVVAARAAHGRKILLWLVVANVVSSILHYVIDFANYPEPLWLNPHIIDMFWFAMTPIGITGCVLFTRGRRTAAFACLYSFAIMNLLTLGHYLIAPPWDLPFRINFFILLEAFTALMLLVHLALLHCCMDLVPAKSL
eukprot:m.38411 g.38411  ORF g.38411 m.38411 type:complete len:166 (-) comp9980_c0_seq1:374-871(-)